MRSVLLLSAVLCLIGIVLYIRSRRNSASRNVVLYTTAPATMFSREMPCNLAIELLLGQTCSESYDQTLHVAMHIAQGLHAMTVVVITMPRHQVNRLMSPRNRAPLVTRLPGGCFHFSGEARRLLSSASSMEIIWASETLDLETVAQELAVMSSMREFQRI